MGLRFCHMPSALHYIIHADSRELCNSFQVRRRTMRSTAGSSASAVRGAKITPADMAAAMAGTAARSNTTIVLQLYIRYYSPAVTTV
jgi:hypothetical protein